MSDFEAGDSEGVVENPEPEDDADLTSDRTENSGLQLQPSSEAEDSGSSQNAELVTEEGDGTESCHASTEELGPQTVGSAIAEACGGEGDSEDEARDHQEEPPEAELACMASSSDIAEPQSGLVRIDSDNASSEHDQSEACCFPSSDGEVLAPGSNTESSDQESPPEDELFAMSETGQAGSAPDVPGLKHVESSQNGVSHIDSAAHGGQEIPEGDSRLVLGAEAPARHYDSRETSEGPEGDSDQAPECDREQLANSPIPLAGCDIVSIMSSPQSAPPHNQDLAPPTVSASPPNCVQSLSLEPPSSVLSVSDAPERSEASPRVAPSECARLSHIVSSDSLPSSVNVTPQQEADFTVLSGLGGARTTNSALEKGEARSVPAHANVHQLPVSDQPQNATSVEDGARGVPHDHPSRCDRTVPTAETSPSSGQHFALLRDTPLALGAAGDVAKDMLRPIFLGEDSDEEELLTELDAELQLRILPRRDQMVGWPVLSSLNGMKDVDSVANVQLCKQFEAQLLQFQETILQREKEIHKLKEEKARQREVSQEVMKERDRLRAELTAMNEKNPDDLYLPQIKEMEKVISQQQNEIRQVKEKLTAHDSAAKRAIASLQSEMKARIDQVTKLYEDSCKEKDSMVVKFAHAETRNIEIKCAAEKLDARVRDMMKEKEFNNNKMRASVAEKQKAVAELQAKVNEMAAVQKEMEKLKEEMSSADFRIKWFQNKLKAEQDANKETKTNLEKVTARLKEAKEETEIIRKDCQAIVKKYQESDEVRSNSLDKELKLKEAELMIKTKEKTDTEEIHLKTKRELEALKVQHRDVVAELKTFKDKVQCLEDERLKEEEVQSKYKSIIMTQKNDNTSLSKQLTEQHTLKEDFDRAQEMIKSLDHEVSELKLNNRDLQKDIEGCRARESKMLALQSELSRTNAFLRSENTSLSNQVATLSGEVQKMYMDLQDLETRYKNSGEQLEEERTLRKEETASLSTQLAERNNQCQYSLSPPLFHPFNRFLSLSLSHTLNHK